MNQFLNHQGLGHYPIHSSCSLLFLDTYGPRYKLIVDHLNLQRNKQVWLLDKFRQ
jgi:hypothetical protein